eukprot:Platyproteum_vivax@DN2925_c0_g1_i1.p1
MQGNAGNMGFRLPNMRKLHSYIGANVLMVSYRGYNGNPGVPSEEGLQADCHACLAYVRTRSDVNEDRVFLFGRSLGGAIAVWLAHREPVWVRGVVLENTFTSIADMVDVVFPFLMPFRPLINFLRRLEMDSLKHVQEVQAPMLLLSGALDTLVPPVQMKKLFRASGSLYCVFHSVAKGTHNDTWQLGGEAYLEALRQFFNKTIDLPSTKTIQEKKQSLSCLKVMTNEAGQIQDQCPVTNELQEQQPTSK